MPNRRHSKRLASFDYSSAGAYFVTICSYQRRCIFNDPAVIHAITTAWRSTVDDGVWPEPYDFVVMPNHIHGIIWLGRQASVAVSGRGEAQRSPVIKSSDTETPVRPGTSSLIEGVARPREMGLSVIETVGRPRRKRGPLLGTRIARFKSLATKRVRAILSTSGPIWQDDYHDRIIRGEREVEAIRQYILDNPRKWRIDPLNSRR